MSRIKSYLLGFIASCTTLTLLGQDQINAPAACDNPPAGILKGGDFSSPAIVCLDYATDKAKVVVNGARFNATTNFVEGTVFYNFNYKDSDGPLTFPTTLIEEHTYTTPGVYWIVMKGRIAGGADYIKCREIEVNATPMMKISYDNCTAGKVSVKILKEADNEVYNGYRIIWGDGSVDLKPFSSIPAEGITVEHTYTGTPANRPVIQGVHFQNTAVVCPGESFIFNISTPVVPHISELEGLSGGSANKITLIDGDPGIDYDIQVKTGNGSWASSGKTVKAPAVDGKASETVTGLNGAEEYCFRLKKTGACATEIVSNEVCTLKATHRVVSPSEVQVNWTTTQPYITRFEIEYKESPTGFNRNKGFTTPSVQTYTYNYMECNKKYEFQVSSVFVPQYGSKEKGVIVKSPAFIVDPATGGKLATALAGFASVDKNSVRVTIITDEQKPESVYNIYRAEGNSTNFQPLTSINLPSYIDYNVEQDKQQYCYKVEYKDECGNLSDQTVPFCTIFLTSKQANTINWTPFSMVSTPNLLQNIQPTQYIVEVLDDNGISMGNWSSTVRTEEDVRDALDKYLDDPNMGGRVTFRVLSQQTVDFVYDGSILTLPFHSYSNTYTFITPARIYVPSAFTPNADAINDIFKAEGRFISKFNMIIYNRWGVPIFESTDMSIGWDGTENGAPSPPGNYSYKIFGIDNAGQDFSKLGSVLLLK